MLSFDTINYKKTFQIGKVVGNFFKKNLFQYKRIDFVEFHFARQRWSNTLKG